MQLQLLSVLNEEQIEKFEAIYQQYKNLMMYISMNILHDKVQAEDAVHDSFYKILINIDDINEVICHETKTWVVIITRRTALNKLKYEKRRTHEDDNVLNFIPDETLNLEDIAIQNLTANNVINALNSIDDIYSEPLIFRYYYGYSDNELASIIETSPETVRKRCERGKRKVVQLLRDMGESDE